MADNGRKLEPETRVSIETLRWMVKMQRIASGAVHKAQEENRRLGVPNWYSINGKIVNEAELKDMRKIEETKE